MHSKFIQSLKPHQASEKKSPYNLKDSFFAWLLQYFIITDNEQQQQQQQQQNNIQIWTKNYPSIEKKKIFFWNKD